MKVLKLNEWMQTTAPEFVSTSTADARNSVNATPGIQQTWTNGFSHIFKMYGKNPNTTFGFFVDSSGSMTPYYDEIINELSKYTSKYQMDILAFNNDGIVNARRKPSYANGGSMDFDELVSAISDHNRFDYDINFIITDGEVLADFDKVKSEYDYLCAQNRKLFVLTSDKNLYDKLSKFIPASEYLGLVEE